MNSNKKGFTLIEMVFCISVILVILLLVIPNVTSKNRLVKEKSCDAQIEVVNSQIILYEIEKSGIFSFQSLKSIDITSCVFNNGAHFSLNYAYTPHFYFKLRN